MRAMLLESIAALNENSAPLRNTDMTDPEPGLDDVIVNVHACGVCHTELDEIEGRTPPPDLPVIPGHEVIGVIADKGANVTQHAIGDPVGVAWIFAACGTCSYCTRGLENLCPSFQATGRDKNGGYAEYMRVPAAYAHPVPGTRDEAVYLAPLMCAGAIGYRALRLSGIENGQKLGLTGFGASAHLVLKLVRYSLPDTPVYVLARDVEERAFARELGAVWTGDSMDSASEALDAIIDTTPAWRPVLGALNNLAPAGRLVINAIRKEAGDQERLAELDYSRHLWLEKSIKSVANITARDVREFLRLAADAGIRPEITEYDLSEANQALCDMKQGGLRGAKVLRP